MKCNESRSGQVTGGQIRLALIIRYKLASFSGDIPPLPRPALPLSCSPLFSFPHLCFSLFLCICLSVCRFLSVCLFSSHVFPTQIPPSRSFSPFLPDSLSHSSLSFSRSFPPIHTLISCVPSLPPFLPPFPSSSSGLLKTLYTRRTSQRGTRRH